MQSSFQEITNLTHGCLQNYPNAKNSVIVIGPIGSGKSTMTIFLANRGLTAYQKYGGFYLDTTNPLTGFQISHKGIGTKLPCPWYDETSQTIYWDSPGCFEDPRGPEETLFNAFSLHQVLSFSPNIKIALVVEEPLLFSKRGNDFLKLLHKMTNLFQDDKQLENCLSLIVTKQQKCAPQEKIRELLNSEEIINELLNNSSPYPLNFLRVKKKILKKIENEHLREPRVLNLLQFLVNNAGTRVASFPYPKGEGIYDPEHQENILKVIQSSQYIQNPLMNITINEKAGLLVSKLAQKITDFIEYYLETTGRRGIISYCMQKIDSHKTPAGDLRGIFKNLMKDLQDLSNIPSDTPLVFADYLSHIMNVDNIRDSINQLAFLKFIWEDVKISPYNWSKAFSHTVLDINSLTIIPGTIVRKPEVNKKGVLEIKGTFYGVGEIKNMIEETMLYSLSLKRVDFFASNTLFIDEDITLPGISVSFIAPCIKVVGNPTINLSGKNGVPGTNGTDAISGPGTSGSPGKAGESGGHFVMKSHIFENLEHLTLISHGGSGGFGGNGGKGADGLPGEDGNLSIVTKTLPWEGENIKGGGAYWCQNGGKFDYYEDFGKEGTRGENGGQGGQGGKGGYAGKIYIDGCPCTVTFHLNEGNAGANGLPGKGGKGGIFGKDCEGKMLVKWHVRDWRDDGGDLSGYTPPGTGKGSFIQTPLIHKVSGKYAEDGKPGDGLNDKDQEQPVEIIINKEKVYKLHNLGTFKYEVQRPVNFY